MEVFLFSAFTFLSMKPVSRANLSASLPFSAGDPKKSNGLVRPQTEKPFYLEYLKFVPSANSTYNCCTPKLL